MAITANSPPDIGLENITLEDLTVVPDSSTSVLLEWKVVPTDGHYCIRNYNIQITGPNGSQWEEQIPGSNRGGVAGPAGPGVFFFWNHFRLCLYAIRQLRMRRRGQS